MYECYAGLRGKTASELAGQLTTLIRDARVILIHPDLRPGDKMTELELLLNRHAPPPPPDFPGTAGGEDRAGETVTHPPALFTDLAARIAGEDVNARIRACVQVDPARYRELLPHLPGAGEAWRREGTLTGAVSGRDIAEVTAVYLPGRMPASALLLLDAGVPLGRALPLVRREELRCRGRRRTRGLLWVPGPDGELPVALAAERLLT